MFSLKKITKFDILTENNFCCEISTFHKREYKFLSLSYTKEPKDHGKDLKKFQFVTLQ